MSDTYISAIVAGVTSPRFLFDALLLFPSSSSLGFALKNIADQVDLVSPDEIIWAAQCIMRKTLVKTRYNSHLVFTVAVFKGHFCKYDSSYYVILRQMPFFQKSLIYNWQKNIITINLINKLTLQKICKESKNKILLIYIYIYIYLCKYIYIYIYTYYYITYMLNIHTYILYICIYIYI